MNKRSLTNWFIYKKENLHMSFLSCKKNYEVWVHGNTSDDYYQKRQKVESIQFNLHTEKLNPQEIIKPDLKV